MAEKPTYEDLEKRILELEQSNADHHCLKNTMRGQGRLLDLIFQHSLDCIVLLDKDYNFVRVSEAYAKACGKNADEFPGQNHFELYPSNLYEEFEQTVRKKKTYSCYAREFTFPDHPDWGTTYWDLGCVSIDDQQGNIEFFLFTLKDVTEGKISEEALKLSEANLVKAQQMASLGSWTWEIEENKVTWSDELFHIVGLSEQKDVSSYRAYRSFVHPDDLEFYNGLNEELLRDKKSYSAEYRIIRNSSDASDNSDVRFVRESGRFSYDNSGKPLYLFGIIQDITEQKHSEAERERLHDQLTQAQKMESVGRLAGGVAHDFNNMLTVICGHADMILDGLDSSHPFFLDLIEIRKAGEHSADLTRQLLAFARKQKVSPKVLDLDTMRTDLMRMLVRLIGENIDFVWNPGFKLWPVLIDPSQLNQILVNLCINSRDAISDIGKIEILTKNVVISKDFCLARPDYLPGDFVLLSVADNGCGMSSDLVNQAFEPFFSTKITSKGTGLGLATVFGIVQQNRGFINVNSTQGQGTTLEIYLPRFLGKCETVEQQPSPEHGVQGNETILLVEDEEVILKMATRMLERMGYTVLPFSSPSMAIQKVEQSSEDFHLLLSDIIMPEMNGWDLSKKLMSLNPDLKCLFMSGYTADHISKEGLLDGSVNFIQKPFSKDDLSTKIRSVLDEGECPRFS